jgi:hypothetical protein
MVFVDENPFFLIIVKLNFINSYIVVTLRFWNLSTWMNKKNSSNIVNIYVKLFAMLRLKHVDFFTPVLCVQLIHLFSAAVNIWDS